MKTALTLFILGSLVAAIVAAPATKQDKIMNRVRDVEKDSNAAALARALLLRAVMEEEDEVNEQEVGDRESLIAAVESLPEEAQEQFWHMLIPAGASLLSSLIKG